MPGYLKILFAALWLTLPLSVEIPIGYGAQMTAPAELLVAVIGVALLFEVPYHQLKMQVTSIVVPAIWLMWGWICTFYSSMPVVSIKYMCVTTAYCWVFFVPVMAWPQAPWKQWFTYFGVGMSVVVMWALFRHGVYFSFRTDQANLAPMPFYYDHTIYGAVLAILIFGIIAQKEPDKRGEGFLNKTALMSLLVTGLLFSTSRGAWLSVVAAMVGLLAFQKKRMAFIAGIMLITAAVIFFPKTGLTTYLQKDVSTAERLNRYDAARRMVQQHPIMGFGPGTYQFQYISFQQPGKMTRISLSYPLFERNPANFGRGGGAHSEYFRALAETGWPGLIATLLLFWTFLGRDPRRGYPWFGWQMWMFAGLMTFFIHSLLNDFFHDPRMAAIVWFLAAKMIMRSDANLTFTSKAPTGVTNL